MGKNRVVIKYDMVESLSLVKRVVIRVGLQSPG